MKLDDMDKIYRERPLEKIPWVYETPPAILIELVEKHIIKPCKTIEFGCGIGNYAIYLAKMGFEVTGVDISKTAIEIAKENAVKQNVVCDFRVADVVGDLRGIKEKFDFAYDWELLHHIFPEKREKFMRNVQNLLNQGGKYLTVSFSKKDPCFGGKKKYRKTPLGTTLYFSSKDELNKLFKSHFKIITLKKIEIRGRPVPHIANYLLMERK
ncbi:MAG: class I SAM-dependent methyltransferase [Promethearchaeota archaeon]|jgi:2-polyprenyl-3-methyl-5-hydroxy-6-metoxy-1,4-benzoquinol methylase